MVTINQNISEKPKESKILISEPSMVRGQDPILAEASVSWNGSTSSKKWKKSTFIFGGIMGLVVLIPIVFSILNVVENSNLKHEILRLEAKLELEVGKNAKTMETNLNKIQSQHYLEIKTREQENEKLFIAIEDNSDLKDDISRLEAKLELHAPFTSELFSTLKTMETNLNKIQSQHDLEIKTRQQENEKVFGALEEFCKLVNSICKSFNNKNCCNETRLLEFLKN